MSDSDTWYLYLDDRVKKGLPEGYKWLTWYDRVQEGDEYDLGGGKWHKMTNIGEYISTQVFCYTPRRKLRSVSNIKVNDSLRSIEL